ncbi:Eukaryotic translation initiation factor 2A [Cucumispora dikerogammari]|nr:Eukaryotic translation initiation factor 2A [Cucumispora dikerogammari]
MSPSSHIFIHYKQTLRIYDFLSKTYFELPCNYYKIVDNHILINFKKTSVLLETKNLNKLNTGDLLLKNEDKNIFHHFFNTNELQNLSFSFTENSINVFLHEVGRLLRVYYFDIKNKQITFEEKTFEKVYLFKTSKDAFVIDTQVQLEYRTFHKQLVVTKDFVFYDVFEDCFMYFKNNLNTKEKNICLTSTLYVYYNDLLVKSFECNDHFSFVKFIFNTNKRAFIVCESTKNSTSYYGNKILYFYENETIKLLDAPKPIHSVSFLNNNAFLIVCGDQPAKCIKYIPTSTGYNKEFFPGKNRNCAFFNYTEELVIFAGINNLPGYFEVYNVKTQDILFYIKRVGATKVLWSPCGAYFLLGITNELKVSNGYTIFDYYGNVIDDLKVEDLKSVEWIGKDEFKAIDRPEKLNIKTESIFKFDVPVQSKLKINSVVTKEKEPSFKTLITNSKKNTLPRSNTRFVAKENVVETTGSLNRHLNSKKAAKENIVETTISLIDQKEEIRKSLIKISKLRQMVRDENYEMSLKEMNLCLQEEVLKGKLKELEK